MTAAAHAAAHSHWLEATRYNPLSLPFLGLATICFLIWKFPKIDTGYKEAAFFAVVVLGTIINNVPDQQSASPMYRAAF